MPPILRLTLIAALAASAIAQPPGRQKRTVTEAEVMRVHRSAILIDTHNDVTSATVAGLDIGKPNTDHMTDIPRKAVHIAPMSPPVRTANLQH